jgi:hypothetical protein
MTMTLTGSCRCGAVEYKLRLRGLPPVYCCHCLDCQKWSGSAFAQQAVIPEAAIVLAGAIAENPVLSRQGGTSIQRACAICHSRIYSTNPTRPGLALLRAGTLDISSSLKPILHIWTCRKQSWVSLPEDVPSYDQGPPSEIFRSLASQAASTLIEE